MLRQVETHATEKHQYDPARQGIAHRVAVELSEDAGNEADVAVDADGDADEDVDVDVDVYVDVDVHVDVDVDADAVLQEQQV